MTHKKWTTRCTTREKRKHLNISFIFLSTSLHITLNILLRLVINIHGTSSYLWHMKISSLLLLWNLFSVFPSSASFLSIHTSPSTASTDSAALCTSFFNPQKKRAGTDRCFIDSSSFTVFFYFSSWHGFVLSCGLSLQRCRSCCFLWTCHSLRSCSSCSRIVAYSLGLAYETLFRYQNLHL